MLDKKTEDLNSENVKENSTPKPEKDKPKKDKPKKDKPKKDKPELSDKTTESDPLENQKSEIKKVSDGREQGQESIIKESEKKEVFVDASDTEEVVDQEVKVKDVSNDLNSDKGEVTNVDNDKVAEDETSDKKVAGKNESEAETVNEKIDFDSLDLEQLVKEFQKLLIQDSIPSIKGKIEKIKQSFNKKYGELLQENKKAFLADGGNEIDFHYSNPIKSVYNDLLFEFKTKRQHYYKQIEEEQKGNLEKKLLLIEELKHLIDNAESSTMYQNFKEIQQKWSAIGNIPRTKYNDTWRTYQHHVERFYDLLHLSNDLRDLDFKHNFEEKLKLVEKAEELASSSDLSRAFKELQVLHKLWKEDIGPVDREHREEIWERFSIATKTIHDKRHDLQKSLETKYEENVDKKRAVINKITNLVTEKIDSHKVWQQKINDLEALRREFFKIGTVPRAENDKIWREFKEATRNFNHVKNLFYKGIKKDQQDNLDKKNALVERAESLKESDDWEITTDLKDYRQVGSMLHPYQLVMSMAMQMDTSGLSEEEKKEQAKHWSYDGETSPEHWAELEKESTCAGNHQSPIDIVTANLVTKPSGLKASDIHYDATTIIHDITNNGHSLQYNFDDKDNYVNFEGKRYNLAQFHFHAASEHTVNGMHFPLVMHMVHVSEDKNFVVFAVMVSESNESSVFDFLESYLPVTPGETKTVGKAHHFKNYILTDFDHYYYKGSLTTPPCTEAVNWFVFKNAIVWCLSIWKILRIFYGFSSFC